MSNLEDVVVVHEVPKFVLLGIAKENVVQDEQNSALVGSRCLDCA